MAYDFFMLYKYNVNKNTEDLRLPSTMRFFFAVFIIFILLFTNTVFAAAPFITNDPEVLPYHHWKFYLFSSGDESPVATTINIPAIQFKFAALHDLELQTIAPIVAYLHAQTGNAYGLGDTAFVVKYRFVHETAYQPQIAFHPIIEVPTGNKNRHLGNGRLWMKMPLAIQKSWGSWKTYASSGFVINHAHHRKTFPYAGWVLQRAINSSLILGGELYSQGRSATNIPAFTILNVGGSYQWNIHSGLLFSAGHNIIGQRNTVAYLGLYWTDAL